VIERSRLDVPPPALAPGVAAELERQLVELEERKRELDARELALEEAVVKLTAERQRAAGAAAREAHAQVEEHARVEEIEDRERALAVAEQNTRALVTQIEDRERALAVAEQNTRALATQIEDRERALAAREAELNAELGRAREAGGSEFVRRRLAAEEEALAERTLELTRHEWLLDERDTQLAEREARVQVELELKEEQLEGRERALIEQADRLDRKEQDLTHYVGQLQSRLTLAG